MTTQDACTTESKTEGAKAPLVRTSILLTADTDRALRELADRGKRPLSWEIRQALEDHVARQSDQPLDKAVA